MRNRRLRWGRLATFLLAATCGSTVCAIANAQEYPVRPVRLVVSSSPGGGTDATARIISPKLSELLGQQVVVENRPGASSQLGSEYVARAVPDGHTLLITASSMLVVQATYRKPLIDPLRELAPITMVLTVPQMLASHPSIPAKNLKELIAFVKARPGKVDYSCGNYGGHPHLTMALFLHMAGLEANYVPYKSGNAGLIDGLSGQVPLLLGNVLATMPHVRTGRLRAYGVTSARRAVALPDIPTIAEAGVPGYESLQWFGLLAPSATPRPVINRLHRDAVRVINDRETVQRFLVDGGEARSNQSPEEFGAFLRADLTKWAQVVRDARLELQ